MTPKSGEVKECESVVNLNSGSKYRRVHYVLVLLFADAKEESNIVVILLEMLAEDQD